MTCRDPEIPWYGPVFSERTVNSGCIVFHKTQLARRLSGTLFFPMHSDFIRGKENPYPGHLIETRRVKARKLSYPSWFARNNGVPQASTTDQVQRILTLITCYYFGFRPKFHGTTSITGVRYPTFHGTWSVSIGYFTVREVSLEIPLSGIPWYVKCHSRFPDRVFHGTLSVPRDSPIGYSTVRKVSLEIPLSGIPWYVKFHSRFPYWVFHGTWSFTRDSPIGYSMVREVSLEIPRSGIPCGTWSVIWDSPIGYFTVREVSLEIPLSDIPRYARRHPGSPIGYFTKRKVV